MKTLKLFAIAIFTLVIFTFATSAQQRSINDVAANASYHSADDGFTIGLPAADLAKTAGKTGNVYAWNFADGFVAVNIEHADKPFKTDEDIEKFVDSVKAGDLSEAQHVKILSESPAKIGEYHGKAFVVEHEGNRGLYVVLAWNTFTIKIVGGALSDSPDVQKRIAEAVQSFEFVN